MLQLIIKSIFPHTNFAVVVVESARHDQRPA